MFENYKTFKTDFAGQSARESRPGKLAGLANGSVPLRATATP